MLKILARIFHKRWYWEHQQPEVTIVQQCRDVPIELDIRNFFVNPNCQELSFARQHKAVNNIRLWVHFNINSKPDKTEFWQLPFETLALKTGDCEDKAILLANLLRAAGIPDWKVRLNAGMTNVGAHVWVTYFDGEAWIPLDFISCHYEEIWFSWTAEKAFTAQENIEKWSI